ncbi:hypothetical protein [Streptomyces sp. NBC_00057]|uniref:hypothetical protein n=1 Tax=Streptomyces sp. NBC_00057 TaxID=2975634 RepID=UPI003248FC6A
MGRLLCFLLALRVTRGLFTRFAGCFLPSFPLGFCDSPLPLALLPLAPLLHQPLLERVPQLEGSLTSVTTSATASTGDLWVYHGKSNGDADGDGIPDGGTDPASLGNVANRTAYATGWITTARPLITASGDSNGDGIGDLWTTTANTTAGLEFIPGRKTGLVGPATVVGTGGWQTIKNIS